MTEVVAGATGYHTLHSFLWLFCCLHCSAHLPKSLLRFGTEQITCFFVCLFCSVLFFKRCCYISFIRENFLDQDQSLQFIVEETVKVLKINDKPVPPSGFLSDGRGCSEQLLPCDKKQLTRHQLM